MRIVCLWKREARVGRVGGLHTTIGIPLRKRKVRIGCVYIKNMPLLS